MPTIQHTIKIGKPSTKSVFQIAPTESGSRQFVNGELELEPDWTEVYSRFALYTASTFIKLVLLMRITCPQCSTVYQVPETAVGKQVRCKKCNQTFAATSGRESSSSTQKHTSSASVGPFSSISNENASASPAKNVKPATQPVRCQPTNSHLDKWESFSEQQKLQVVMNSFCGEFPKPKTAFSYKLGLLFATGFMALIPVIYIGIIALVGYGVYWHAISNTGIFNQSQSGRGRAGMQTPLLVRVLGDRKSVV